LPISAILLKVVLARTKLIDFGATALMNRHLASFCILIGVGAIAPARALPPPEDIPEEVLRIEIMTEARSPLDGEPLTAAEYAELRARLEERGFPPEVSPQIRHLIFMLEIRRLLNTFTPIPLF
jgi:hypothetical protein